MSPPMSTSGREALLIQRFIIGIAIVVVGLLLGRLIPENYFLPAALVVGFGLLFLLLKKPVWFVLLGIFFYYGALRIVDTEVVGRVAGLFRLKDVFLAMMVLHIVATHVISRRRGILPAKASSFRLFLLFMGWIGFQMWRTVFLLGEEQMLMFRVGRHFLTYGYFIFILYYFRSEKDWKGLKRYMHALAFLTIGLGVLTAFGINTTLYPRGSMMYGGFSHGIFKYFSPGESLVFAMFMYNVWRFCFRPTWRNGVLALILAGGCTFFIYRARLAGMVLGMAISTFLAPPKVRSRALVMGVVTLGLAVMVVVVFGLVASNLTEMGRQSYLGNLVDYFDVARRGVTERNTDDVMIRQLFVELRWPLVRKSPFLGVGFVSPFGRVAWEMFRLGDLPIGHVDVGWLDALMSLGGIGTCILAVFLISAALEGKRIVTSKNLSEDEYAFGLTIVAFVVTMFVSTYSFAYPTREESILTFSLLYAWIMRMRSNGLNLAGEGGSLSAWDVEAPLLSVRRIPTPKVH